jgi:hypothetical protein
LQQLCDQGNISRQVLEDFPDGIDLHCTEPDFEEFHTLYGYRPQFAPDALRRAFFALFSATRDWTNFRGSGFIPAADLERLVETVEDTLESEQIIPEDVQSLPEMPALEQRRQRINRQATQQSRVYRYLEQMEVPGIDPGQTLRRQKFSPIEMQEGESVEEVFSKLQSRRKR